MHDVCYGQNVKGAGKRSMRGRVTRSRPRGYIRHMIRDHRFDTDSAVRLLQKLIRIDTTNPPGNEAEAAGLLAAELSRFGLDPEITDLGAGRANVSAVVKGEGVCPAVVYNGHLDVVPVGNVRWSHPPFGAEIHRGRLYGRGASDMKSGLAAMLTAAGLLARSGVRLGGDLIFSAVADEEIGGLGADRFLAEGGMRNTRAVIIGEPTGFRAYIAEKGVYWITLETVGKTAHGAMPHLGRNAILDMQTLLAELQDTPLPNAPNPDHGGTTMNVGSIRGGVSANVVPDSCTASVDVRIPPGVSVDAVLQGFREAAERAEAARPGMTVRIDTKAARAPVATPHDAAVVQTVLQLCAELFGSSPRAGPTPGYATDASILCREPEVPFVIIGPGRERQAHQPDEYVLVEDYLRAVDFYRRLAERLLPRG